MFNYTKKSKKKPLPFSSKGQLMKLLTSSKAMKESYGLTPGNVFLRESAAKRAARTSKGRAGSRAINRGIQTGTFGGDSASQFSHSSGNKRPEYTKMLGRGSTIVNVGNRFTSLVGKQNMVTLSTYFNPTELLGIFNNIQAVGALKSQKYLIEGCHARTYITNQHNNNGRMTIYDLATKIDGNTTVTDPSVVFLAGSVDASGGAAVDALVPGFTPSANPRFKENYTILKTTEIILAPGATHVHKVDITLNKIVNYERFAFDLNQVKGITFFSVAIIHGSPSNDSVTKTSATVSLGTSTWDVVSVREYSARGMLFDYASNTATNSLPLTFAVAEDVMGEDGNVIVGADA